MSCKICNAENMDSIDIVSKKRTKTFDFCAKCNSFFLQEKDQLSVAIESERYNLHNNSYEDESYREYFRKFYRQISEFMHTENRILDFGSGPSPVFALTMKEIGYTITTYDKFFDNNSSYKDFSYDVITSTEVFEHLKDPMQELELLVPLLKKDGYLIIMTNFHPNDPEKFKTWWYPKDDTHVTFFSRETFEYIAEQFHLKIVKDNGKNIIVLQK